jgi:MinD-like ATPase involved in chromosome partitioning or flagellar assembly
VRALHDTEILPVGDPPAESDEETAQSHSPPLRRKPKEEKQSKPERVAPEGVPIPTMGLPAARYWLHRRFGRPDKVPRLNKLEQFEFEVGCLEQRLRSLAEKMQITICFLNVKGGSSKTTTSIYIGSIIADVTKLTGYVLPATTATETCNAAQVAGVDPQDTLSISQFAATYQTLESYRDLSRLVRPTQFGLRVIAEDPVTEVSLDNKFSRMRFRQVAETLRRNADFVIYDTGNDNVARNSVPLEAARGSDVIVFTATASNPETLEKLSFTMRNYLTDDGKPSGGLDWTQVQLPTAQKASKSIVVISRTGSKQGPSDFVPYVKHRDRRGTVIGDIGFDGDILTVPEDPFVAGNIVANLREIQPETYLAYLELAVAIYENAAELRDLSPSA